MLWICYVKQIHDSLSHLIGPNKGWLRLWLQIMIEKTIANKNTHLLSISRIDSVAF